MAKERTTEEFADPGDFARWLSEHHRTSAGIWMRIAKKGSAARTATYRQALEVALCFGWIDGQKRALDDDYFLQGFSPRTARSPWSRRNREIAERLERKGALETPGRAEVERARADGRWERAYDGQARAEVPADLAAALEDSPRAREFFAALDGRNRYAAIYRVQSCVKAETRARRIAKFVAMFEAGEKFHP
ncbi:hypothetical protein G4X40_01985 [Rhodococcus sp. D2-41]|uniref:YdeI/OmpD-associated family protein n=1 Tax=Speluncibacter jeojiensis TaxID=2710754 RepID=A0A9X4RF33_9ACTN|nr:YdeI/OmpD-associated family protein [Rhodococcus sp. D2-41]MDG3008913.1 hypothetical protein [Rhodococcus sp. D2-41]MDG3016535.1 YdeI/OmpD-associated family protein [Corynebacteriales bacterium D3-21]